jgi:NAD(P)-dependent dehydrogenase (short-subunit alcohol dehydrogenase family)
MTEWMSRFALTGKRALVTGATKGIGFETCRVLADAGADIVALGRDEAGLAGVKAEVEKTGRRCATVAADLASADETLAAADTALAAFGGIDILVNNAGIARVAPMLGFPLKDYEDLMAVNLRAPFLLSQKLAPGMIARKAGKIVNVSSQSGVIAIDDHAAYIASKGGLNALTKALACEWARHNVQINAVCPNVILTPMGEKVWGKPEKGDPMKAKTPARRFGKPVEVADMILYLASPASDFVNGTVMMIDGGYTAL